MQTPFLILRPVAHPSKNIAILKLSKLALCPLAVVTTQPLRRVEILKWNLINAENSQQHGNNDEPDYRSHDHNDQRL